MIPRGSSLEELYTDRRSKNDLGQKRKCNPINNISGLGTPKLILSIAKSEWHSDEFGLRRLQ